MAIFFMPLFLKALFLKALHFFFKCSAAFFHLHLSREIRIRCTIWAKVFRHLTLTLVWFSPKPVSASQVHKVSAVTTLYAKVGVEGLRRSTKSPDLNPTKPLWSKLKALTVP